MHRTITPHSNSSSWGDRNRLKEQSLVFSPEFSKLPLFQSSSFVLFPCNLSNKAKIVQISEFFSSSERSSLTCDYTQDRAKCHLLTNFAHFLEFPRSGGKSWVCYLDTSLPISCCRCGCRAFGRNEGLVSLWRNPIGSHLRTDRIFQKSQTLCNEMGNSHNFQDDINSH